jgi:hypothetical protein
MSGIIDFASNATKNFLREEAERESGGGGQKDWFKFKLGANNLRFLYSLHTVTRWDVLRGFCGEELIGQTIRVLAVPVERVFIGTKPNTRMMNTLVNRRDCPLWQNWFAPTDPVTDELYSKEAAKQWRKKNSKAQPKPFFLVNCINTDAPEEGVHVIAFSRADWLGPRSNTRPPRQVAYGIFNAVKGFKSGEQPQEDAEMAVGKSALADFPGFEALLAERGEELFGPNGRDVIIHKSQGNFGLQLDTSKGIALRDKAQCLVYPEEEFTPVDILNMPSAYPGYVSGKSGDHLDETCRNFVAWVAAEKEANKKPANTEQEAQSGVEETQQAAQQEQDIGALVSPSVDPPEAEVSTPASDQTGGSDSGAPALPSLGTVSQEETSPSAGETTLGQRFASGDLSKSRKRKIAEKQIVMAVDPDDCDEENPDGAKYLGYVSEVTDELVTVILKPEDQITPALSGRVETYIKQGASEFYFEPESVTILD